MDDIITKEALLEMGFEQDESNPEIFNMNIKKGYMDIYIDVHMGIRAFKVDTDDQTLLMEDTDENFNLQRLKRAVQLFS